MTKKSPHLPLDTESNITNMKKYVYFRRKERMRRFLSFVGYFRGSRYGKFLISKANNIGSMPSQDMLFDLYDFDTKLRELLFRYCQIAEIQFKTYLADSISVKTGDAFYYANQTYYTPTRSEREKIKGFQMLNIFKNFSPDFAEIQKKS